MGWRDKLDEIAEQALDSQIPWEKFALACRDAFFTLALIRAENNKSNAAKSIGMSRNNFRDHVKNRGIRVKQLPRARSLP